MQGVTKQVSVWGRTRDEFRYGLGIVFGASDLKNKQPTHTGDGWAEFPFPKFQVPNYLFYHAPFEQ